MTRKLLIAPLALVVALAACVSDESLNPPTANPDLVDELFARYVAFGNSITAGFQSGGINDSVQALSYANLLAEQMGTEFEIPLLNKPGCPPPYTNIFTLTPVGDPGPLGCALRHPGIPERLGLVAIPGAAVLDIYDPLGAGNRSNTLTTVMGGGRSQVENAAISKPTFVTVWIGNNDALGAATDGANPGDPAKVTPPATFAARYTAMLDSLDAIGSIQGGVLMGVVQVGVAPYFTQGRVWKGFELQFDALTAPLNVFDVANACLTFTALTATDTAWTSVPFPVGGPTLSLANAKLDSVLGGLLNPANLVPAVITCADDKAITNTEMANLVGAITQYNATIEAAAADLDWIYVDPNDLLASLVPVAGAILSFPAFPGLPGVTPEMSQNTPFGFALSRDGIHPSTSTHQAVAAALVQAINAKYGTSIPAP
ncbi:MAG: SGNH/GDSL hydrolase family protein [Gemmatimonadota bacterium]|nr:SGNH/GDSL hydrolase family protein [Gemmatimonadota bacterium]